MARRHPGTKSNRVAIGARVSVKTANRVLLEEVRSELWFYFAFVFFSNCIVRLIPSPSFTKIN